MACGWKYYNHAYIPDGAPHEQPDMIPLNNGSLWKSTDNKALLARWTTNFDCGYETEWWYCIKDKPFDVGELTSKRRYEITKAERNFETKTINPSDYADDLFKVQKAAFSAYPAAYRPEVTREKFDKEIGLWSDYTVFAAFDKQDGALAGYSLVRKEEKYIGFDVQKTNPEYEKKAVNAALVKRILDCYADELKSGSYICDGARNIMHETNFQGYLEKYFMFRRAYCTLNIKYKVGVKLLVKLLYPFRKIIAKMNNGLCKRISGVLRMEHVIRKQNKVEK